MKKTLLTCIIISFQLITIVRSQTIPNGNFENWTQDIWDNQNPDDWETSNLDFQGDKIDTTAGYMSSLAMRAINYGTANAPYAKCNFPINLHPESLNLYVKTEYSYEDTVNIAVNLYFEGALVDNGMWLNSHILPVSTWTPVSIPISQMTSFTDSAEITITGGSNISGGTILYVDSLSFFFPPSSTLEDKSQTLFTSVFPNPATNELNIRKDYPEEILITLYDWSGKKIKEKNIISPLSSIGLEEISNGIYFYEIKKEKQIINGGKLIIQ